MVEMKFHLSIAVEKKKGLHLPPMMDSFFGASLDMVTVMKNEHSKELRGDVCGGWRWGWKSGAYMFDKKKFCVGEGGSCAS